MKAILYYVHDPMCSWCWGFSAALKKLLGTLPRDIEVQRLLGGLAADSDVPMPESMQQQIKSNWLRIEDSIPGVRFNFDFWSKCTPRRSTYPACRAVIAARNQGKENDEMMTRAIQKAYYQQARNPSDYSTLIEIADETGLSVPEFESDILSTETEKTLKAEIQFSREIFAESFPNLILQVENEIYSIPIDYNNSHIMLDKINTILKRNK
ncbi:MAG: DsbA family protein [Gammaproteobacteria bacterium]|nr:DsbA family protein [Gammaproteobacteria bacterium]